MTCRRILPGKNSQCGGPIRFGMLRAQVHSTVLPLLLEQPAAVSLKVALGYPQGPRCENSPRRGIRSKPASGTVGVAAFRKHPLGKLTTNQSIENHQGLTGLSYWPFKVGNNTRTI